MHVGGGGSKGAVGGSLEVGPSRPRKDGTGPFRDPTPTIQEMIDKAFEGEVIPLRPVDLAPIADRGRIRRGEPVEVRERDSDESDGSEPSVQWRNQILNRLDGGDTKDIATVALEALERVIGSIRPAKGAEEASRDRSRST